MPRSFQAKVIWHGQEKPTWITDAAEDAGGPRWLSPAGKTNHDPKKTLAEIRAKHRAKWLAEQKAKRERSLGRLTPDQENWLAIALAQLQRLFEAREVSKPDTGHDASTRSCTSTFVKRKRIHYVCTCRHIVEGIDDCQSASKIGSDAMLVH
jgi:hypothetical protein